MSFNPYQPPANTHDVAPVRPEGGELVSASIVESLRKTRPWVMFLSITGIVFAGLSLLIGVAVIADSGELLDEGGGIIWLMGAGIHLVIWVMLLRYGASINELLHGGGVPQLEQAIDAQTGFWRLTGLVSVVLMLAFVGLIVLMVAES